ncbi:hypothetical protein BDZ97DRAFT_1902949 [Flammula alnicola]|nr:hypothetical protein BDZ97DRAFT_1902949 [Flammula alnicola]
MLNTLPLHLLVLAACFITCTALPDLSIRNTLASTLNLPRGFWPSKHSVELSQRDSTGINFNPNGSAFLWLPQDEYSGKTFFDRWEFFSNIDPTNYVNQTTAVEKGYIFTQSDGTVIMKADDQTVLPLGVNRDSVRITSTTQYNTGLFILDLNRAPWGCAIWPAFWTVGVIGPLYGILPNFSSLSDLLSLQNGEVDILEGVHDNEHNQIAWHTNPGCLLDPNVTFTGQLSVNNGVNVTNCDANVNSNSGCDVTEWSRASYGPFFEAQGGGILAMKWDENDISVWSFFRAAIPNDVTKGTPNPSLWGTPSAMLKNTQCNIEQYFSNHSIVFGDWAGNSYATSGCPGTCPERLMDPTNFVNATWSINSLKVFRKQLIAGNATTLSAARPTHTKLAIAQIILPVLATIIFSFLW